VRGAVLYGWQPPDAPTMPPPLARDSAVAIAAILPRQSVDVLPLMRNASSTPRFVARQAAGRAPLLESRQSRLEQLTRGSDVGLDSARHLLLATYTPSLGPLYRRAIGVTEAAVTAGTATGRSRWSGSAWSFVRGGGRATALSPGGQIGGGQAGARILYRLDDRGIVSAAGRLSTTIGGIRQSEAAVGIDIKPISTLPIHLMAERRIALDSGGRNAWTLGAAGGLYAVPLGGGWRLDAYGEAGVVGARRRDLYADGAARIARAIDLGGGRSLALGGGIWAAAQPKVSRIDVGPSAVLRLPVAARNVALALDWRQQVAGDARPHSGIAFTTAVDF
jgi:hypothetical protein